MATKMFLGKANTYASTHRGTNTAKANGSASGWDPKALLTAADSSMSTSTVSTVAGPTSGLEMIDGSLPIEWLSEPFAADVTISGTITLNVWMSENNMSANVGAQVIIERLDSIGAIVSTIANTESGVELPVTTRSAQNWTVTATSTNMLRGDRVRVRVLGNDVGTMASGFNFNFSYGGPTAAADGDSWVQFNENITFETADPTGSTLYLTTASASSLTSASIIKRKAALSRGAAAAKLYTESATGWITPIPISGGPIYSNNSGSGEALEGGTGGSGETSQQLAQRVKIWDSVNVSTVVLRLNRTGTVLDNVELDIVSSLGGSVLGTSLPVVGSSISTSAADVSFTFASAVSLSAGDYYLVLRRTGARDATNYINWFRFSSSADFYPDGEAWRRNSLTWTSSSSPTIADFLFKIPAAANVIEWYSEPLDAFTLGGKAMFKVRASQSSSAANTSLRAEIAVCDGDGSGAVVWGVAGNKPGAGTYGEITTNPQTIYVSGDDTAVAQGKRLRFKLYIDDPADSASVAGHMIELEYNGPTASTTGDTYIILPQTVTEYVAASFSAVPDHLLHRNPYQHLIVR